MFRQDLAIQRNHLERTSVQVHRVNEIVAAPDETQRDGLAHLHPDHVGAWICLAVNRNVVRHRRVERFSAHIDTFLSGNIDTPKGVAIADQTRQCETTLVWPGASNGCAYAHQTPRGSGPSHGGQHSVAAARPK